MRMKSRVEYLPVEIWVLIFSYLDAQDIFRSFTNLNNYFNRLLSSNHLSFHLRLQKSKDKPIQSSIPPIWLHEILQRIVYLESTTENGYEYIPEYLRNNIHQLIQLHSLIIRLNPSQLKLCQVFKHLHSLDYLSITSELTLNLIDDIFSIPTLRVCHLVITEVQDINSCSNKISNIEVLNIHFLKPSWYSLYKLFSCQIPKLKQLKISQVHNLFFHTEEFNQPRPIFPLLETIKLQGEGDFTFLLFVNYFRLITPALKRLYIDNYRDLITEYFLNPLLNEWWPIFENINQINICIRSMIHRNPVPQIVHCRKILMAKNDDYDNQIQIKWIEKNVKTMGVMDCRIEITKTV